MGGFNMPNPSMSPGMGAGLMGGLGFLSGLFPQTSSQNQSGWQNTNTSNAFNTGQYTDLYNTLASILESQGSTTGTTTGTQSMTPTMTPETLAFMNNLMGKYASQTTPSLTGYAANQTSQINQSADVQKQAVDQILAARGLSSSPAAATAQAGVEQNRLNQITGMKQQIPVLQNQMNLANLAGATGFFSTIPKGMTGTTTGTSQQDTRNIQSGTQTGHQFGQQTASGYSSGAQQQIGQQNVKGSQGGGLGGAFSGAASGFAAMLPFLLMSDRRLKKEIKEIPQVKAIEKIRELKSRTWKWNGGDRSDSGFVAQELEDVLPELVSNENIDGKDLKMVNYAGLIPYLVGAVQNLDSRI